MTITIAWVRRNKETKQLILASDSRLRSNGSIDQAQKLFRTERGDICLAFCGDAQIAYPLFVQVSSAFNNFIKMRTRAYDITDSAAYVGQILNNFIDAWNLPAREKAIEIKGTRIMVAGWSWKHSRFEIGYFAPKGARFTHHHQRMKMPHPWHETHRSLTFLGDYEDTYREELGRIIARRRERPGNAEEKVQFDFEYEPLEALHALLRKADPDGQRTAIGGSTQMVKVYPFGNSLPYAIRSRENEHYLLGRKLFEWEKTEYPVVDLTREPIKILYPMSSIPVPGQLQDLEVDVEEQEADNISVAKNMQG